MQRLEVSGAVRPIYGSLGVKRLTDLMHKTCASSWLITKTKKKKHIHGRVPLITKNTRGGEEGRKSWIKKENKLCLAN